MEKTILKINDNINILADEYQYILSIKNKKTVKNRYYPTIDMALTELIDDVIKNELSNSDKKTLSGIVDKLSEIEKTIEELISNYKK